MQSLQPRSRAGQLGEGWKDAGGGRRDGSEDEGEACNGERQDVDEAGEG